MAVDSWKNADSSQERSAKRTEKKGSRGEKSQVNEVSPCYYFYLLLLALNGDLINSL